MMHIWAQNAGRSLVHQIAPLFGSFAFKYEIIMECPGGKIFCSSSCSTNSGIQKQEPNRLTIPHNSISVTCNLFSMIIRYLERDTIRKKQLNAFCCCCLQRISCQPRDLWRERVFCHWNLQEPALLRAGLDLLHGEIRAPQIQTFL